MSTDVATVEDGIAARAGDTAFAEAAHAAAGDAYRLAGYLLHDAAEAEDAVQDALLRAWRHWPGLRDPSRFAAWLDQIVVNCCRDRYRRRCLRLLDLSAADEAEATDEFRTMFERDVLAAAVRRLPYDQQVVVALRYWRDLTVPEIAARLSVPEGTVKSRLHTALAALERRLGEHGDA